MAVLSHDLFEFERSQNVNRTLFTVYQLESAVELRSGRDEAMEEQIFCSSLLYDSAHKIAQIVASQHNLPFYDYTDLHRVTSETDPGEKKIG
ncbi:MAG: hypothetical protein WCA35_07245 [Kovacikia sp.]